MNDVKRFSAGLLLWWAAAGIGLAQSTGQSYGDSYASGGPVSGADQQVQAADLLSKRGQQKVDLFTGSFGYSIPIACPPARNGSEPNLALAYSSSGGNGWCGMGWNLELGDIERNTREGVPIAYSTATPPAPLAQYDDAKGFLLNLPGKGYKLFAVATNGTLVEYRAEVDTEFLRCFLDTVNNLWTVYDKGGNAYLFGGSASTRVANPKAGWSGYRGTFHWALDQVVTATGDWTTIAYTNYTSPFTGLPERTLYPAQIAYNGHTNWNGYSASFPGPDKILFQTGIRTNDWNFSFRSGFRRDQTRQLTNILCQVGAQNVWNYSLNYGLSAATARSLLTNVVLSGFNAGGIATAFVTNTFAYQANPHGVSFGPTMVWTNLALNTPGNNDYPYSVPYEPQVTQINDDLSGFPYTVADLMDMDGDGLPDRVVFDSSVSPNQYQVQKNLGLQANGRGSFGTRHVFNPTSSGGGSTASGANPLPDNSGYAELNTPYGRIRDINGDGLPDRVMDYWAALNSVIANSYTYTPYTNYEVQLNTGQGFAGETYWPVSTGPLAMTDVYSSDYFCVESGGAYVGLFDINGDGLPDRVMANGYLNGAMTNFMVQFNTGTNFTQPMNFGPYHRQNWNGNNLANWAGIEAPEAHMIDLNGDGLPDRVMYPMDPNNPGAELPHPASYYAVEFNDGYSFESTNTSTGYGGAADKWPGVVGQAGDGEVYNGINFWSDAIWDLPFGGMYDLNGDGLPDRVVLDQTSLNTPNTRWFVYLNNGHGFNSTPIVLTNLENQSCYSLFMYSPWWSMQGTGVKGSEAGSLITTLIDINGDGLLDRVMSVHDSGNGVANSTSNYFLVQLNQGPFPDLMTNVNNGLGGVISVSYNPSTAYDNRVDTTNPNSVSHMPFPKYMTAAVAASDGVNPLQTTTYGYGGGYYDGVRREFHGFAVVTNTDPTLRAIVTYFHTGGGRNYSALGEYQDTNAITGAGNFAKAGLAYRVETYGNDGELYHVQVNQINQTSLTSGGNPRYFPFTALTFDCDYPGNGTPNVSATQFTYDPAGNVTNKIEYGQVNNFTPANFSFTDANTVPPRYYNTTFAAGSGNSYIVNHPATAILADGGGNTVQETDYSYNALSGTLATKLTRISASSFATNSFNNYTTCGLVGQIVNPVGVPTAITYDSTYNTYPATTTAGSFTTTTSYDPRSGRLAVATDPAGLTVSNSFDAFLRPTETDQIPIGGGTAVWMKRYDYPAVLQAAVSGLAVNYVDEVQNDGVGGITNRTYVDGFGRSIQTCTQGENSNYRVVSTAYDGRGNAFLNTWPVFGTINFTKPASTQSATWIGYDAAGRVATNRPVSATFNANGAFSSATPLAGDTGSPLAARTWSYTYGGNPWWIVYTDEDGQIRRYGLDAYGRTNQIQEADGSSTYTSTFKYDLADNLTSLVNANAENIFWAYNQAGGLVAMADPYLGPWTYVRDYAGRLRLQTDARGDVVSNSYVNPSTGSQDALGRLQVQTVYSLNYSNHTLVPAFTNTFLYDNGADSSYKVYPGLLYEVIDSQGWEKNGYDPRARTIKTARYLSINGTTNTIGCTFDDGNNATAIAYPNNGPTVTNSYFHGGSLNLVSLVGGGNFYTINASGYDQFGHATNFAYGNGVTTTRGYYPISQRLQTIAAAGSAGPIFSRTYQYTAGNDIANLSGTGVTNAVSVTYYNLHRIKTYSGMPGGGSYAYDPTGNLTNNIEGGGSSYAYANPRIQAVRTAFGYTNLYDLCGNMLVRHGGLTNSQAMVYDPENRLSAIAQAGVMSAEFGYAFDGARLWKRLNQNPTNLQVWIGCLYEQKAGKNLFHVFANGEQVCTFETNSALYGGGNPNAVGYYYHQDSLASSSVLSGSSGVQTEVNVWYPFGRIQTAGPQAGFQVSRRFTGQVFDAESGLYYYNARYYDPELGRFIQPDDIIPDFGNPQSYNRYSYCRNNPWTCTDPSGHDDTYTGASGRALLQADDADATGVVLRARQSAATTASVLRTAVELNPIVGAANGGIGLVTGHDAITHEKLTVGQRLEAGGGAVLSATPFVFKAGKLIKVAADAEEVVDAGKVLKSGWAAAVESDKFLLAEKQAVSGIIKDGKVIGIGDAELAHRELAEKLGIQLINGKLPPGMEGFLAQKIGGKINVAGAAINGSGAFLTISDAGKKAVETFMQ